MLFHSHSNQVFTPTHCSTPTHSDIGLFHSHAKTGNHIHLNFKQKTTNFLEVPFLFFLSSAESVLIVSRSGAERLSFFFKDLPTFSHVTKRLHCVSTNVNNLYLLLLSASYINKILTTFCLNISGCHIIQYVNNAASHGQLPNVVIKNGISEAKSYLHTQRCSSSLTLKAVSSAAYSQALYSRPHASC